MGQSPDKDDESDVELHPDEPSFITAAVCSPIDDDEETDKVRVPLGIPRYDQTAPVQLPRDETTARAVKPPLPAPADGEMQTLQVGPSDHERRPRKPSRPDIATASGLTHRPRSSRVGPELLPDLSPPEEWEDASNASFVTPKYAPGELLKAELAFAGTAGKKDASAAGLPADDEPDTTELGGNSGARIGAPAESEDRTMPKASVKAALRQEDATLEPPRDKAEIDLTRPKVMEQDLPAAAATLGLGALSPKLPPMRPRFDSEAAGHWPSGFAQTDDARAALLNVISPVSSDTAVMPRPVVEDPLTALRSQIEASLAKTEHAIAPPPYVAPSSPRMPDSAPGMAATPALPSSSGMRVDRARESDPSNQALPPPSSRRGLSSQRSRSLSPIAVFFATFVIVGGVLGGVVAVQQYGWFGLLRSKTPAAAASPQSSTSASTPDLASASPPASISANPSASASTTAPASSTGTRIRTRPRPRPRHP